VQKQKKKAQVGKDVMAKRSHNVFGDGSHTSSIRGFIPTKWPARIINTAYNKYHVPVTHQLFIGNRMHSYPNSYYSSKKDNLKL